MTNFLGKITFWCKFIVIGAIFSRANGVKRINVAFFLDEADSLEEIIINSSTNLVNYYSATQYVLNPLIYRIEKNKVSNLHQTLCDVLEKGLAAIFSPETPEANEIIQSASLTFEIPHFQTFPNPSFEALAELAREDRAVGAREVFNFNLFPSSQVLSKALAALISDNDWKSYAVLYQDDDGLVRLQDALKMRSFDDAPVICRKLGRGPDYRIVLKELVALGALHIILDCETSHIMDVLLQAQEVNLFQDFHSYVLTSLDAHILDFTRLGDIKTNVTFLRILDEGILSNVIGNWELVDINYHVEIPLRSIKVKTALLYDALNLLMTSFSELDVTQELKVKSLTCGMQEVSTHGHRLTSFMAVRNMSKSLLLGPISGPIAFDPMGQRVSFRFEIVEVRNKQLRVAGVWDSKNPDFVHAKVTSEDREKEMYQQLRGRTFRVVSRIYPPYLSRKANSTQSQGNEAFEGYSMDLMDRICELFECNYVFELVPDNNYGKYDPKTGKWNGLIRHLLDRKADLGICDLTTTYERRRAVDFTNPFMTLGISILYAKIVKEPPELLSFTNPLSLDVWLYMLTSYMVISMIIFLVARINPNEWENPHPCNQCCDELENAWNIKQCFWLTLGSIMQQGCEILPKGICTRIVTGMWWFFTLIIIQCYTANLAAFLTQERMGPTIRSAEDLASQNKIKYGCVRDGATASFFRDSNVSLYHKMWVQMETAEPSVFENSNEDGVKRVISSNGKYAFLMESSSIEYETEKHCELVQVGNRLDTKGYGIAMPIDAPYRTSINQAILKMQEMGTLQRLRDKWWKEKNQEFACTREEKLNEDAASLSLTLAHVGGVFVVLSVGMSLALVIAVMEFLWTVRKISVKRQLPFAEAFKREMRFALDIWSREKPVNPRNE